MVKRKKLSSVKKYKRLRKIKKRNKRGKQKGGNLPRAPTHAQMDRACSIM